MIDFNKSIDLNKPNGISIAIDNFFEPVSKFFDKIGKRYDEFFEVPQSYRMQQKFHNHLRGKPTWIDANGNLYVKLGDQKYYL